MSSESRYGEGWGCPTCHRALMPTEVTFEETHDVREGGCGEPMDERDWFTKLKKAQPATAATKAAIFSKDLYAVLTDVQNGINSPGLASMANSAIRKIDAARAECNAADRSGA